MMRTSKIWQILAASLLAYAAPGGAQTPSPAPPEMEKIEEVSGAPSAPIVVTPKPGSGKKITEKREQGRVTEIKVTRGKSTYYIKPNNPTGTALPGDATGSGIRGPQWQVMEFDLARKNKKQEEAEQDAPAPPAAAK